MEFPSSLVEKAVTELSKLPSIGKKSALRLVLHLLSENKIYTEEIATALVDLVTNIQYCSKCHSISDNALCGICESVKRDHTTVCVVETTKDVLAIENTSQYFGVYHILGGIISPIDGIGPQQLNIDSLIKRVSIDEVKEIILALSSTMEGDTTAFYISKKLKELGVKVTTIARGVPIGGELEYADEITLARSIMNRSAYNKDF